MASLAALAVAALLLTIAAERPSEVFGPRGMAELREAFRTLPAPPVRADLSGVPAHHAAPLVEGMRPASFMGQCEPCEAEPGLAWLRPRAALIDLPPPGLVSLVVGL